MTEQTLEKLKYPIGKYTKPETTDSAQINQWIDAIEKFPKLLEHLVKGLSVEQLHWEYRPQGWNIKQVVHHCADSHMNAFIRVKLALTEDSPTIKPYFENRWAKLIDNNDNHLEDSLVLLKSLHAKLTKLLRSITHEELKRDYIHPEFGERFSLDQVIALYAWHSNHHLAHVKQALEYQGKF